VVSGEFTYLKNHLRDFVQVEPFDAKEAQNEFAWQFDTLKERIIVFTKVVFYDVYKAGQFAYLKHHFSHFV
jgi:hypothetical protein